MSKQSQPPPRGDKPTPTAPPPPPGWRHWLWPIALMVALVLFLFLPRFGGVTSVNLSYSTFISDVQAHKVKTFTLDNSTGSTAPATGTLKNGDDYTTVIPLPFAGTPLETTLQKSGVQINAAIWSSDLRGFTAFSDTAPSGRVIDALNELFDLQGQAIAAHGGEILNTMGDGMLLCFPSAVQAVGCALQIQLEFGRRRETLPPEKALEHRIGIHLGDIIRQAGGVAGDGVNIAARLQTKAPPGGICISQK